MNSKPFTKLIGIDWGSTHCRAFRFAADGEVFENRQAASGVGQSSAAQFEQTLNGLVGDWRIEDPSIPLLLCGMVGSKQGWVEVPYLYSPSSLSTIVAHLHPLPGITAQAAIVPGLTADGVSDKDFTDIMRGEETQVFGCITFNQPDWVVSPGTHSKWIRVSDGEIHSFRTYMTGETFALLRQHSLIGKVLREGAWDAEAFSRGVSIAKECPDWLHQLFGVRARGVLAMMSPVSLSSYLSGLLIGYEVNAAVSYHRPTRPVTLIATPELARFYTVALDAFGLKAERIDSEIAASRGLWQIAMSAGWVQ